jgi:hypothetical protein
MGRHEFQKKKEIMTKYLLILILAGSILASCTVEEAKDLDRFMIYEKQDELTEFRLSWKTNGLADEGTTSDIWLYISESEDMDDAAVSQLLGKLSVSGFDYRGYQRIVPSRRSELFDAYRYYVGVAYNGLNNPDNVTFPLTIEYSIEIVNQKTNDVLKTIDGTFTIEEAKSALTRIEYVYTLDFFENSPETEYRNYSLRQLSEEIVIERQSDVTRTNVFVATKPLYVDLLWKTDGGVKGYRKVDLDLHLHNTNNTAIETYADLDDGSASETNYEGFTISVDEDYLQQNATERIGFSLYELEGNLNAAAVDYTFIVYQYDGNIKRMSFSGSFNSPPLNPDPWTFYFVANLKRTGETYTISKLASPFVWTP